MNLGWIWGVYSVRLSSVGNYNQQACANIATVVDQVGRIELMTKAHDVVTSGKAYEAEELGRRMHTCHKM